MVSESDGYAIVLKSNGLPRVALHLIVIPHSIVTVVLQLCSSGVAIVLLWCCNGVTVLFQLRYFYSGIRSGVTVAVTVVVTVVLQWCYSGIAMMLKPCYICELNFF
jgi:hypothetical protein